MGIALAAFLVVVGVGIGAYFVGASAADDSDKVEELEGELAAARQTSQDVSERVDEMANQMQEVEDENEELRERLEAEQNLSGEKSKSSASGSAPTADLKLGAAASVGDFTVKPTSVERVGGSGGEATFRATLTVKNDGSESDSPFCGGGATLIDQDGRSFDGEAVIGDSSAACDDLQPGLTSTIQVDFKTPSDAEPAALELAPDSLDDSTAETWEIP